MTTSQTSLKLPGRFEELVDMMPPRAIINHARYEEMIEVIDRLMRLSRLTKGQEAYLETLVQLVQAYEAKHHAIETTDLDGVAVLRQLLEENGMNASDLSRLLGVHASMGSKLLKRERSLTVEHLRKLSERFKVRPEVFMG